MSTTIGTANFISRDHAIKYYRDYGFNNNEVKLKIENQEIFIGSPQTTKHESLSTDRDGRYHITSPE